MNQKRAQVALEYLSTYIWMLLAVVIVLTALIWLGVFSGSPGPDQCNFNDVSILCQSPKASPTDFQVMVRNHKAHDIFICDIICDSRVPDPVTSIPPEGSAAYPNCESTGVKIESSGAQIIRASTNPNSASFCTNDGLNPLKIGQEYKEKIYLVFTEKGQGDAGTARVSRGFLLTAIQPS